MSFGESSSFTERSVAFEQAIDNVTRQLRRPKPKERLTFEEPRVPQPVKLETPGGSSVVVNRLGNRAEALDSGGSVYCNTWMGSGRHAKIWHALLSVGGVLQPDTCIGVIGRNYSHPSNWATPLDQSKHAVCVRVSDGVLFIKGRPTSLILRPLLHQGGGSLLRLTLDMPSSCLTFEVVSGVGSMASESTVLGSLVVDTDLPPELTPCVGFAPSAAHASAGQLPSSVKLLGVTAQQPDPNFGKALGGKGVKDLWDDENVVTLSEAVTPAASGQWELLG